MRFDVQFQEQSARIALCFNENRAGMAVDFGTFQTVTELINEQYTGEYEIRPLVEPQTLETKDKVMMENMTILEIPYAEVSNTSGGITATIG